MLGGELDIVVCAEFNDAEEAGNDDLLLLMDLTRFGLETLRVLVLGLVTSLTARVVAGTVVASLLVSPMGLAVVVLIS